VTHVDTPINETVREKSERLAGYKDARRQSVIERTPA